MIRYTKKSCLLLLIITLTGCRGWHSEKSPIHPNINLDMQAKFKAQALSLKEPEGTISWGNQSIDKDKENRKDYLQNNTAYYTGQNKEKKWVAKAPITVNKELLKRGQERYNIYCAICHDQTGSGRGTIIKRGFVQPPNLSANRIIAQNDGELFNTISYGIRSMPAYRKQIPVADRWAIVTYIRALQKANNANFNELPNKLKNKLLSKEEG